MFLSIPIGFCSAKDVLVSPSGRDTTHCRTIDNPCLTIQYAIDNSTMSGDVIKIDGSLGNFTAPRELQMTNCTNITFTSYNGVAWIHRDRERDYAGNTIYGILLKISYLRIYVTFEIQFNTLNFRDTQVAQSHGQLFKAVKITMKNCLFEFSESMSPYTIGNGIIAIRDKHSIITIESCTIKANC